MRCVYPLIIATCFICHFGEVNGQTAELRFGLNRNHLYQTDNYADYVDHKDGLGAGLELRLQKLHPMPLLKNLALNLDLYRSNIYIREHRSPGGAGGNVTSASYRTVSLGLNNYFINFGTVDKPFQAALGLSAQYKIYQYSQGYYTRQHIGWDTFMNYYSFTWTYHTLNGRRTDNYYRLSLGLCAGIGFRPFRIGKQEFRTRYDFWLGLTSENRNGLYFGHMSQRLSLGILISGDETRYRQKLQIKTEKKKARKTARNTKQAAKPTFTDKSLEFGLGFNLYRFKVHRNDATRSYIDPGFGFGFRAWDWPGAKSWPAVALEFEQVNYQIEPFFLISTISGQFRRNTLSAGIYPLKWLLFKKRLDIRIGLDIHCLISNRASGTLLRYDQNSGLPKQRIRFTTDVLKLHNRFNAGPVLTMAVPLLRKENYCLRWRNTFAYNFADMTVNGAWGNGQRIQSELAFNWRWPEGLKGL